MADNINGDVPQAANSAWARGAEFDQTLERERLIGLHTEAWAADPKTGAMATHIIHVDDLPEILASGRFELVDAFLRAAQPPLTCRCCGTRVDEPAQVHAVAITTAAIDKPRFAMTAGFCASCSAKGWEHLKTAAMDALKRAGILKGSSK